MNWVKGLMFYAIVLSGSFVTLVWLQSLVLFFLFFTPIFIFYSVKAIKKIDSDEGELFENVKKLGGLQNGSTV